MLRMGQRPAFVAFVYGVWVAVLGCFVAGGYATARIVAFAVVLLSAAPLAVVSTMRARPSGQRKAALALPWMHAVQVLLLAAVTGGLHSPCALGLLLTFLAMYARHGGTPAGRVVVALFCGGVLYMAIAPRSWTGPVLADPWFVVAAAIAAIGSLGVQAQFVRALQQTAADAVAETLRVRDELADQALARARDLELIGSKLSHELNNPMTAIKGLVQVVQRSVRDPTVEKQLGVVEREIERMTFILQSHIGFSRPLDRIEATDADIGEVADSVLGLLEGRAKAAAIVLERKGNARAKIDPKRLRGALINLVANAIDACPRGSRVEIALAEDEANIRVTVIDNGRGMAPHVLQRVGTPFFTTRERGTGLGVVLARAAFEHHGGTLEYRSVPGQGTTVVGTLPRAPPT
jgi:signal transduction histidine kinase